MRLITVLALFACIAIAQEPVPYPQATGEEWREGAAQAKLSPEAIAALEKYGVVMTGETYAQVFTPYVEYAGRDIHSIVTSESILHAFHVLLAETYGEMENRRGPILREALAKTLQRLPEAKVHPRFDTPEAVRDARRKLQIVLGTALRLIDPEAVLPVPEELRPIIQAEVARVEAAEATLLPDWLVLPNPDQHAIDYARFKPDPFHDRSEALRRTYRAVTFLRTIPFVVERTSDQPVEGEVAISLLYEANVIPGLEDATIQGDPFGAEPATYLLKNTFYQLTYGRAPYREDEEDRFHYDYRLYQYLGFARSPRVSHYSDHLGSVDLPGNVRLISSPAPCGDDVLFHICYFVPYRGLRPGGLHLASCLNDKYAHSQLPADDEFRKATQDTSDFRHADRSFDHGGYDLYEHYLHTLRALVDEPEPRTPAPFRSPAWQAKSTQTLLAGWAQMQLPMARGNVTVTSGLRYDWREVAFIEPEPEFYRRLGRLADDCANAFEACGLFRQPVPPQAIRDLAEKIARLPPDKPWVELYHEDLPTDLREAWELAQLICPGVFTTTARCHEQLLQLAEIAAEDPDHHTLWRARCYLGNALDARWRLLVDTCFQLESLAYKQLNYSDPFDRSIFKGNYGHYLAYICGYLGSSLMAPRDDAPRAVDATFPVDAEERLTVGIGRPQAIYVIYPWRGLKLLCRGVVMPYYEFRQPAPATPEAWRELLDSDACAPRPDWLKPLTADQVLPPAKAPIRDVAP